MKRVTFAVTCSPFLLADILRKHLTNQPEEFQRVSKVLLESLYVDDFITLTDSTDFAQRIFEQGRLLMSNAGMNLRKGKTNHIELSKAMGDQVLLNKKANNVLGLTWYTELDEIGLDIKSVFEILDSTEPVTKRKITRTVAKIYDPLGLASPYIILAKILLLLKTIGQLKVIWDVVLPENIITEWLE